MHLSITYHNTTLSQHIKNFRPWPDNKFTKIPLSVQLDSREASSDIKTPMRYSQYVGSTSPEDQEGSQTFNTAPMWPNHPTAATICGNATGQSYWTTVVTCILMFIKKQHPKTYN